MAEETRLLMVLVKSDTALAVVSTADEAVLIAEEVVSVTVLTAELAAFEMAPVMSPKLKQQP